MTTSPSTRFLHDLTPRLTQRQTARSPASLLASLLSSRPASASANSWSQGSKPGTHSRARGEILVELQAPSFSSSSSSAREEQRRCCSAQRSELTLASPASPSVLRGGEGVPEVARGCAQTS